jgi:putative membrane fusion protein
VISRGSRIARKQIQKRALKIVLLSCLAVLCLGLIYNLGQNAYSVITILNRDIKQAEYGYIEDKLFGQAVVINKEEVTSAQYPGRFENMVKDKEKTSKGRLLGYYISSRGQTALLAPISGIFIRQTDGLEEVFKDINLQAVTPEVFKYQTRTTAEDKPIQAGQTLYKITNNLEPTRLLFHSPLERVDFNINVNQKVNVILDGKDLGKATIKEMKQDFNEVLMILEFRDFQEELLNQRFVDIELIFDYRAGYLVPEKALVELDGKKGIYCADGENLTFKAIDVIKLKDGKAIVAGLNDKDMMLLNPTK